MCIHAFSFFFSCEKLRSSGSRGAQDFSSTAKVSFSRVSRDPGSECHRLSHPGQVGEGVCWDSYRLLLSHPECTAASQTLGPRSLMARYACVNIIWLREGSQCHKFSSVFQIARELHRGLLGEHAGSPSLGGDAASGVRSGRLREPAPAR